MSHVKLALFTYSWIIFLTMRNKFELEIKIWQDARSSNFQFFSLRGQWYKERFRFSRVNILETWGVPLSVLILLHQDCTNTFGKIILKGRSEGDSIFCFHYATLTGYSVVINARAYATREKCSFVKLSGKGAPFPSPARASLAHSATVASLLSWCFFSSSIVSLTDLFPPKHEAIRGKSNFSCGSDSGLLLYFANSALMSWIGSSELNPWRLLDHSSHFISIWARQ